jgi:uncharacterized protein
MILGLIADTHGLFDPQLSRIFADCELILHAGDVDNEEVLAQLSQIAPVRAVRGNVDSPGLGLPLSLNVLAAGLSIHVLHILPAPQSKLSTWAESARTLRELPPPAVRLMRAFDPSVELVVWGHSHQPCLVELGNVLWANPGSAGRKRFKLPRTCARLHISNDVVAAQVVPLEAYDGVLPRAVRFKRLHQGAWKGSGAGLAPQREL